MSSELGDISSLATRFFDSIEAGDIDGVASCYSGEVEIWHNTDRKVDCKSDNLTVLRGFVRHISNIRYTNRRVSVFQGGFVQQHLLTGKRKDGTHVELPAAIICSVENGKIVRLDEYFDSKQVAVFVSG